MRIILELGKLSKLLGITTQPSQKIFCDVEFLRFLTWEDL